ncbi:hypothetical protein [Erwinia psidii]|uniref:hypothetical protein n=1 Tax=Erwinia psidii TaxID=69224 RepID=UPI0013156852|nr:hypothetical protein [Erwinia psidii]
MTPRLIQRLRFTLGRLPLEDVWDCYPAEPGNFWLTPVACSSRQDRASQISPSSG